MNPLWKVYKSKVLKTLNPEEEEEGDTAQEVNEVENDVSPVQEDEGPTAVSQLAKRVQGAGVRGWNRMSALFNKDDEHQLLEETESPPVPDHPLAVKPEEPPRPAKRSAFWDSFATNWAAKKQAEAAAAAAAASEEAAGQGEEGIQEAGGEEDGQNTEGAASEGGGGGGGGSSNHSFSKYVTLGGGSEEASFKWNFVTSKLADLKTKSMTKTN